MTLRPLLLAHVITLDRVLHGPGLPAGLLLFPPLARAVQLGPLLALVNAAAGSGVATLGAPERMD